VPNIGKTARDGRKKSATKVNVIGTPMGSGIRRPPGSKAAKLMMKQEQSNANVEACKVVAMTELEATQKQLTPVLKQNMKSERLLESCKIYTRLGMRDKALEVMKKIEALDEPDECTDVPSEVLDGSLEEVASCPETSPLSVNGIECIVQCENYTKSSKV
jgi:hypothetical protein